MRMRVQTTQATVNRAYCQQPETIFKVNTSLEIKGADSDGFPWYSGTIRQSERWNNF